MDHPIAHPRNAVLLGITFAAIATIYLAVSHDAGGAAMMYGLSFAMTLAFYVLAAGSPRG
jgi:hypothetical protein